MAVTGIAKKVHEKLGTSCVSGNIAPSPSNPGQHNCHVTNTTTDSSTNQKTTVTIPECDEAVSNAPCFQLAADSPQCQATPALTTLFRVCNDSTCGPGANTSGESKNASISCEVM